MKKVEEVEVPEMVYKAHIEYVDSLYCDKCGEKIYRDSGEFRLRHYYDSEIYKERKYKYYKGFDFCHECTEKFLLPLLSKELGKEENTYEVELSYEDE